MAYPNYYQGGYFSQYQNGAVPDMLNQYKGQYQPIPQMQQNVPQPIQQNFQQMPTSPTQQKPNNDMIWTQGLEGAKGYLVAPNNTVVLWDTERPTIYVKSADASGVPSMRVLDFEERNGDASNSPKNAPKTHECTCGDKFVTKSEFDALKGKFYDILAKYDDLLIEQKQKEKEIKIEKPKTTKTTKKEAE